MLSSVSFFCRLLRLLTGFMCVLMAGSPVTKAAPASSGYGSVRMFGVDYVDSTAFGRKFGLSAAWKERQKTIRLSGSGHTIEFTVHSVESTLNGLTLFLSEPVVLRDGKLYLSRGDADDLFAPILTRNAGARRSPVKTVVIDAGHGGNDPGNQNRRLKLNEKTYTLDVARRLQRLLKAQGLRVVMTRTSDRAVDLDRRADMTNKLGADLFISIHFNAFSGRDIAGTETYVMTPYRRQSSPQAERDERMMRTKYPANRYDDWNAVLGFEVHRALISVLKSTDRGLKRFRYSVLRSVNCPAVLVEAAFLSNDAEGSKVATAAYRQRIAQAIASGVRQHVAQRKRAKPTRRRR